MWQGVTGESWAYTNWRDGEPNSCHGFPACEPENVLSFGFDGQFGLSTWNDVTGATPTSFICEWPDLPLIFTDVFESGDVFAWSHVVP